MTWYLVFRALCVCAFVASLVSLIGAGMCAESNRYSTRRRTGCYLALAAVFAVTGCLLVGIGWTPVHP